MKKILILIVVLFSGFGFAQESEKNPVIIISSYDFTRPGLAMKMIDKYHAVEWDNQVKKGNILGWGYMQHWMADEYDVIFYFQTTSLDSWQNAATEVSSALSTKMSKDEWKTYTENTINHKDGLYIGRHDFNQSMIK